MINRLSLIGLAIAMAMSLTANAQHHFLGQGAIDQSAYPSVKGDLRMPFSVPGRIWIGGKYADQGLGYTGSYVSIGTKTRMFEDFLDGRWVFEGRGHVSENGGFFGNFGVERIFSLAAANADLSLAGWYDYDDDQNHLPFGEAFHQWGVTGQIKTRKWDLIANGYFPFSTTDTTLGDPTGGEAFFRNRIVLQAGIDSALEGFDVTLRTRPEQLAFVNGAIDFGGYHYESDLVDSFGGGRMRLLFQVLNGWIFNGEINYDDRFNMTGYVGLTWVWGGGGRGLEYAGVCADLVETPRNDHIVRFNQDVIYAIDPDTGRPYNVVHVDNTASGTETGHFEAPFNTLAEAEAASIEDDIIFVNEGDGSTTGYDAGIALKDGQLLLGDGVLHLIPIANGGRFGSFFALTNDIDGIRPRITNDGGPGVLLANRNTVRGFVINGNLSPGVMDFGIEGIGGVTNTDGLIEDNMILGAALDGIGVTNLAGDWTFNRNEIENNGFNGIRLEDACDPDSVFTFDSNVASNNGLDGIQITNYIAREIIFTNNETSNNGRDGIRLEDFKGDPGIGVDILIDNHVAQFNIGDGINIINGAGNITITNSIIGDEQDETAGIIIFGGNASNGIHITDFTNPGADDRILIMDNDINGNGAGFAAGVNIELNEGTARALITGNQINSNGVGISVFADDQDLLNATPTMLDIDVVDNIDIGSGLFGGFFGGNISDGMRFITDGGAIVNVLVDQTGFGNQSIIGNGGNGISFIAGGTDTEGFGIISTINATIRDATISGSAGDGVFAAIGEDAQLNLLVEDSVINTNADGFDLNFGDNPLGIVSSIAVRNNTIDSNAFSAFELNANAGSFVDVALINNTMINTGRGGLRPDGVTGPGFADGITITAAGDASMGNPEIDTRVRLLIQANTVDLFTLNGLEIVTTGDASVLANIDGNTFTNNGDGFLTPGNTQPDLPFGDGISFIAAGRSSINARVVNNLATGNAERGMDIGTFGASTINATIFGNNFAGNDVAEDPNNDPVLDILFADFEAINGPGSNICLSLSNTFIALADNLVNNSAMEDFVLELDGGTNGLIGVPFPANIDEAVFGSTCDPLITAEEMAFLMAGFPPDPPPVQNPNP